MYRPTIGDYGWVLVVGVVLGVNITAAVRKDESLSEAMDRYLASHYWVTKMIVLVVARHLTNDLPEDGDALHWLHLLICRVFGDGDEVSP